MHPERFGRALGFGVRQAARTLSRAAEAAAAPAPARRGSPALPSTRKDPGGLREGTRRFTSSVVAPARRAGSVLWLEITGFFFGLFAALAGLGVWVGRAHLRPGPGQAHELAGVLMCLVFGWFAVSNFIRAHRRARRP